MTPDHDFLRHLNLMIWAPWHLSAAFRYVIVSLVSYDTCMECLSCYQMRSNMGTVYPLLTIGDLYMHAGEIGS